MQEFKINITNSSKSPLRRIFVELLDKNKNVVEVRKTDDEGNVSFDGEIIKYYSILSKYKNNEEYREIKESLITATHTHCALVKFNENSYLIIPTYNNKRIKNIVCSFYDKAGKKVGEAISNEENDCNIFINVDKIQPTYFVLKTKQGEKKKFKDVDSRKDLLPSFRLKPNVAYDIKMVSV